MKYKIPVILIILFFHFRVNAQVDKHSSSTILEYDGQYFMPYSEGIKEKSLSIAPEIAKLRPSPLNLLKKKMNSCISIFYNDTIFSSLHGLKTTFMGQILPQNGMNEFLKWLPSQFEIRIYTTLARDSMPYWEDDPEAWVTVYFNNPKKLVGTPVINDIFVEPREAGSFSGYAEYDRISVPDRIVAVKDNGLRLFEPVSREDFILSLITFFQTSIEKGEKQTVTPATTSELLTAGREKENERLKFEERLKEIRKYDPLLAEKLMQAYEAGYSVSGNQASIENENKVDRMIVLNTWREAVRKLKAEMNAMSSLERKSQAWWSNNEDSNVSGLTLTGFSGSRPLVRLNRNLIDKTKPNTDIQLIVIEWSVLPDSEITETEGFNLAYAKLLELIRSEKLWSQVFRLIDH